MAESPWTLKDESHIFKSSDLGLPDDGFIRLVSNNYSFKNVIYYYPKASVYYPNAAFTFYVMYDVKKVMIIKDKSSFATVVTKCEILFWINLNRDDLLFYCKNACYSSESNEIKLIITELLNKLVPINLK